jgi:predicted DNA-binding mobile mystery protein A
MGPRPPYGWIRTIRDALGMSTAELAWRMGVSDRRVRQIELAELDGSVGMATLQRAAASLNCTLCYVLIPNDPLHVMVYRQALEKASEAVALGRADLTGEDGSWLSEMIAEQVEAVADQLVDRRGLWTTDRRPDAQVGREK